MPCTDQQPFTEADVDRYAQFIAGHPDAIVAARHLAATRAVLDGLAQDGRLLAEGEDRDDMLADLADLAQAQAVIDATRRLAIEANARLRAQLLEALGREDDGRTPLSDYVSHLVAQRDALKAALGREVSSEAIVTAARDVAGRLLRQERQHSGSGRDGHLGEDDLVPLFEALGVVYLDGDDVLHAADVERLGRALATHDAPVCDALCRDIEEDRDQLVAAIVNWRDSHRGEGAHPADRDLIALADRIRDDAR